MIAIAVPPIAKPINSRRSSSFWISETAGDAGWNSNTPNAHADIMKRASSVASDRYSGQCARNAALAESSSSVFGTNAMRALLVASANDSAGESPLAKLCFVICIALITCTQI
jgi:hypothetical protein